MEEYDLQGFVFFLVLLYPVVSSSSSALPLFQPHSHRAHHYAVSDAPLDSLANQ
jgi:hypothetical protein